jgi:nanoRNase/pAp phosphatase (c-di-AMP/oligoRNAs hydrolase)
MRIVTRADFDGIVCAALLYEAETITEQVRWVEPNEMQKGFVEVHGGDIIANLPYHPECALWFDHHYTNRIQTPFEGLFRIAPSAAGLVYEYYRDKFRRNFDELILETDRIDSADLSADQVLYPENYPYILLSMTISSSEKADEPYWNKLVEMIRRHEISHILQETEVRERRQKVIEQNKIFKTILEKVTSVNTHVSLTDFRSFEKTPVGNRFLVYSLFPETVVNIRIRNDAENKDKVIIGVGHSIFNRNCRVNVGLMLSRFGGGGHSGAGSCTVSVQEADTVASEILGILLKNQPNE